MSWHKWPYLAARMASLALKSTEASALEAAVQVVLVNACDVAVVLIACKLRTSLSCSRSEVHVGGACGVGLGQSLSLRFGGVVAFSGPTPHGSCALGSRPPCPAPSNKKTRFAAHRLDPRLIHPAHCAETRSSMLFVAAFGCWGFGAREGHLGSYTPSAVRRRKSSILLFQSG